MNEIHNLIKINGNEFKGNDLFTLIFDTTDYKKMMQCITFLWNWLEGNNIIYNIHRLQVNEVEIYISDLESQTLVKLSFDQYIVNRYHPSEMARQLLFVQPMSMKFKLEAYDRNNYK